jgi:2-amino-4-hydroxy-6-hydroxymethyldihydropteridine diphosphokinase
VPDRAIVSYFVLPPIPTGYVYTIISEKSSFAKLSSKVWLAIGLTVSNPYVIISTQKGIKMQDFNSVPEELKPVKIYLGLGSNLGDTAPTGNTEQPRFLNLVCEATTSLMPAELLQLVKEIEKTIGREPGQPNSPRPIDIDILFYGDQITNNPELVIPHPRLTERAFVLVPLADIAPNFVHPVTGHSIRQMLKALKRNPGDVVRWENI